MRINEAVSNQRAVPRNWGFGESKEKKTPFFWIDFEFLDIEGEQKEKLTVRKDWYLTDNTIEYVLMDMRKFGWAGRDITEWEKDQSNSFNFAECEIDVTTEIQSYVDSEGRDQKVAKVKYLGSAGVPTIEPTALKGLAAKMKGKIAAFNAKHGTAPAAAKKAKKDDFLPPAEAMNEPKDHWATV
jgi:hypothetical protein